MNLKPKILWKQSRPGLDLQEAKRNTKYNPTSTHFRMKSRLRNLKNLLLKLLKFLPDLVERGVLLWSGHLSKHLTNQKGRSADAALCSARSSLSNSPPITSCTTYSASRQSSLPEHSVLRCFTWQFSSNSLFALSSLNSRTKKTKLQQSQFFQVWSLRYTRLCLLCFLCCSLLSYSLTRSLISGDSGILTKTSSLGS